MVKRGILLLFVVQFLMLVSFASASISISEVDSIYNLQDKVYITINMVPNSVSGNFEINLVCKNQSLNFYKISPAESAFTQGKQQKIVHTLILNPEFIGDNRGSCYISAVIGEERTTTKNFEISNSIVLTAKLDKQSYNPGEQITLSIEAIKENSQALNGFLEVSGASTFNKAIENGKASEKFTMPENTEARDYFLNLFVYDRGKNNEIMNKQNQTIIFTINQVPTSLQTSLSSLEIMPGNNITIGSDLSDQTGKKISGVINTKLTSNKEEASLNINSGEFATLNIPYNATKGLWKATSNFANLSDEEKFTVLGLQKVSFDFEGNILIVKNIGNEFYNNTVNVSIGETQQEIYLEIPIYQEKRFNLMAPDGNYTVIVGDDGSRAEKTILLTGNAIGIKDLSVSSIGDWFSNYPIIWIFLLLLLLAIIGIAIYKIKTKKEHGNLEIEPKKFKHINFSSPLKQVNPRNEERRESKEIIKQFKEVSTAETSTSIKGQQQKAAVLSIKIANMNSLGGHAHNEIRKMLALVKDKKGIVQETGNHIVIIFSPSLTKISDNENLAVKAGLDIFKELYAYNKKSIDKIEFNIGIHSGEIVASLVNGKLSYASIGNTVLLAKKLADSNKEKVLVSEYVKNKLMRDLKVERAGQIGNIAAYSVLNLINTEENKRKLDDILKRMQNNS